ncbi:MAG TPA: histidine phosphatase family protein [Gaiellaceae bacterium]|nr:histidine phosphatase family protein [Gaiellaceae bacterium]
MSRLTLIRHCEPEEDARGRCYGSLDVELSPAGKRHADALAARLGTDHLVWTSPRRRARQTAAPLTASPHVDDDLRELDFGAFEGRTYDEIAESEPDLYRAWMQRPTRVRFPGGESWADLKERTLRCIGRVWDAGDDALVVTHGGVIRAALSEWLAIPDEAVFRLALDYGGITVAERIEGATIVRIVNG